ncbi:MAG TPA: UDP-N-acetylglucosamine 1-carboxyvinyltransferase [Thermoanaerobaculia bacterium]|nr:UDP-N-acetylglucosamine 1-carboxyvinyltransferase [Thermoanaerobaculia bacterium]
MDRFRIQGPVRLAGRVRASGAKNAALPALAACLLASEPVELSRMPRVRDIRTMSRLLGHLGVASEELGDGTLRLTPGDPEAGAGEAPYELVKTMRAGVLSLGPLLARRGRARVSLPGGCAIGVRPVDQHLAGLAALGAEVRVEGGYVEARVPEPGKRLRGGRFRFAMPTVTGTENVLMAAVLAAGTSVLENCAREPEIGDLARLLTAMGARIEGAGTDTITVHGVAELGGARHEIIPDRIEGGTYLIGAALTGGDVTLEDAEPADLAPLLEKLAETGAAVETEGTRVRVSAPGELFSADVETAPHPRFPTDLQAQYLALMTAARGVASVSETVFENRFQHVPELARLGAVIEVRGGTAKVHGPTALSGAYVMATDLRASACLVLAALAARGETLVHRIYHLDRGYERMEEKLQSLGASVERVAGPELD